MRHVERDDHDLGGVTLPPCEHRTELPGGRLHCGHTRVQGYPLDLVSRRLCRDCPQRLVPCDAPRPAPSIWRVGPWLIAFQVWGWGRAAKRLIRALTLGLLRPRPCCRCQGRAEQLDRLGALAARWWRRFRGRA